MQILKNVTRIYIKNGSALLFIICQQQHKMTSFLALHSLFKFEIVYGRMTSNIDGNTVIITSNGR